MEKLEQSMKDEKAKETGVLLVIRYYFSLVLFADSAKVLICLLVVLIK